MACPTPATPRLHEFFAKDSAGLACAYLFGSVARRTSHERSDVDIALLYRTAPDPTLLAQPFELEAELTQHLAKPVQLVVLNRAPVDLVHRVLQDGQLIVENDRSARIAFEVKARNEYFDLLPFLKRYRQGLTVPVGAK